LAVFSHPFAGVDSIVAGVIYGAFPITPWIIDNSFFCVIDLAGGMLHTSKTRKTGTPCIIIGGTEDKIVPYSWSENLSEQLNENNIDNVLHGVKGAPHDLYDYEDEIEDVITKYLYKYLTGIEPAVK
jgi:hypothetical protein